MMHDHIERILWTTSLMPMRLNEWSDLYAHRIVIYSSMHETYWESWSISEGTIIETSAMWNYSSGRLYMNCSKASDNCGFEVRGDHIDYYYKILLLKYFFN